MKKNLRNLSKNRDFFKLHVCYNPCLIMAGVVLFLTSNLFQSCSAPEQQTNTINGAKLARVYDTYLYSSDLKAIYPQNISKQDSVRFAERYIDNWIRKELFIKKASEQVSFDALELERKVADYRYTLLSYEFEKQYLQKINDTAVSAKEIEDYYHNNPSTFQLKSTVFKGVIIKVPENVPKLSTLRQMLNNAKEPDLESLKSYALRYALEYSLDKNTWLQLDEIIAKAGNQAENSAAYYPGQVLEIKQNAVITFVKIKDIKQANQVAPLALVEQSIKSILLNKRKIKRIEALREDIYNEGKNDKLFEIY